MIRIPALLIFMPFLANAQVYNWVTGTGSTMVDESYCVYYDNNENSYISGVFYGSVNFGGTVINTLGGGDMYVVKYDASGNVSWIDQAGGPLEQGGHVITVDGAGNVYVAGEFEGNITFSTTQFGSVGMSDIFLVKYDPSGTILYTFSIGGTGIEEVHSIEPDGNGNLYMTGSFESVCFFGQPSLTSIGSSDIFVAKFNSFGGLLWTKRAGGTGEDRGRGLAVDPNGEVCITGFFNNVATFGGIALNAATAGREVFAAKADAGGNFLWAVKAGGSANDGAYEADADASGNFYITGAFRGTAQFGSTTLVAAGEDDAFIARLGPTGVFGWAVAGGGKGSDRAYAISVDGQGMVYATGSFEDSASFGNTTLVSAGDKDVFITALNSSGTYQWAWDEGGAGFDRGYGIEADAAGVVWVTGVYEQNVVFGNTGLSGFGMTDLFLAKFGSTTGIHSQAGAGWSIFPNPAHGTLHVSTGMTRPVTCRLYDLAGSLLQEYVLPPGGGELSLSGDLPAISIIRLGSLSSPQGKLLFKAGAR